MAVFTVTDTAFTDDTLPIVARDPAIDSGTLFCIDLLDTYSWPSQAAGVVSDTVADLNDGAAATLLGSGVSWSNGFEFGIASTAYLQLPASSDLASDVNAFAITTWVMFDDLSGTTDSILTHGESGSGYDNTQYMVFSNLTQLRWAFNGGTARTSSVTLETGVVYQIGVSVAKSGSSYTGTLWVNGVAVDSVTIVGAMVDALDETGARVGFGDIFGAPSSGMVFYRANANDLSRSDAASFIAADYAVGLGRF